MMAQDGYRKVGSITADELLAVLTPHPQHQIDLFVQLGGHPDDHDYARLSFLTMELRERGVPVRSSLIDGIWLTEPLDSFPSQQSLFERAR